MMSERQARIVAIEVLAPTFMAFDIPGDFKIRYNLVGSSFSYSNMRRYLSRGMIWVMTNVAENQAVVRYESPSRGSHGNTNPPHRIVT